MTTTKNILVCFTASFPYGLKETFLENELPFLANEFDRVLIIPVINYTKDSMEIRNLPNNVLSLTPTISASKSKRIINGLFNLSPIYIYLKDFFRGKVYLSNERFKTWFNSLLLFRTLYKRFNKLVNLGEFDNQNVILYSYWGEAPIFATKITKPFKKVLRMHRVDFYEEVNDGYLPLRKIIYNNVDLLLPISTDIKERLINDYSVNKNNIFISRLGIDNNWDYLDKKSDNGNVIRIVSCSRVDPVKRVRLILESISKFNGPEQIEWHHFGDGTLFEDLLLAKNKVEDININVKIILHGWATQVELFDFYKSNFVHCFINVSESEGIPVSIMEAMSFGIPVIATDVGATSEIVNDTNGVLLSVSFEDHSLLRSIENVSKDFKKRLSAYETWKLNYQANINYKKLTHELRKLIG